jgi:PII-like signaling protein
LSLSPRTQDLPIVVEIVDSREKIEAFMPTVDHAISEGLARLERVMVRLYRAGSKEAT